MPTGLAVGFGLKGLSYTSVRRRRVTARFTPSAAFADLGQLVSRLQVAQPERVLDLLDELQVGGHTGRRVEPELERGGVYRFTYCHR